MIGFLVRLATFGLVPDLTTLVVAPMIAAFGICGCVYCYRFRMRNVGCIRRFLRCIGYDAFDDFEAIIFVHEASFRLKANSGKKSATFVRVIAGGQMAETDESSNHAFHTPISILIEQGSDVVKVELIDYYTKKILGRLRLDVVQDMLKSKDCANERWYGMVKGNGPALNPKIKLSIVCDTDVAAESGLLQGSRAADGQFNETDFMLRQHFKQVTEEQPSASHESDLDLLAKACAGPLERFKAWGRMEAVHIAILSPPEQRKHALGIWTDAMDFERRRRPGEVIELARIQGVMADPGRHDVFLMGYIDSNKRSQQQAFKKVDRARDVWVELLQLLVKRIHDQRSAAKEHKRQKCQKFQSE